MLCSCNFAHNVVVMTNAQIERTNATITRIASRGHNVMTRINMNNDASTQSRTTSNKTRSRRQRNNTKSIVRDIALKTILNDIIRDDKSRTLTTKQMRVVLRREFAQSMQHAKNNAWTFSHDEMIIVRSRFDAKFRARNERASKRASRKNAKSNDVVANVETTNA